MWTVRELIEALEECPAGYQVSFVTPDNICEMHMLGIDRKNKTVDLFIDFTMEALSDVHTISIPRTLRSSKRTTRKTD